MATAAEAMGLETAAESEDAHVRQKAEVLRTMVAAGPCRDGAQAGVGALALAADICTGEKREGRGRQI